MYFIAALIAFLVLYVPTFFVIRREMGLNRDNSVENVLAAALSLNIAIVLALMWPATMAGIAFYYLIKILDLRSQR